MAIPTGAIIAIAGLGIGIGAIALLKPKGVLGIPVASVVGVVKDMVTQMPIAGAVVRLNGKETKSFQDGGFMFDGIGPGTYNLVVNAPGFPWASTSVTIRSGINDLGDVLVQTSEIGTEWL